MITAIGIATLALTQQPTGAELVGRMLTKYNSAETIQGTIDMTQVAQRAQVKFKTEVAIQSPTKIRLAQERIGSEPKKWLTVADGTKFAYDRPPGVFGKDRFLEQQSTEAGFVNVRDVYAIVAENYGDRSPVLDALVSRPDHLRNLRATWGPKFTLQGQTDWQGKKAHVIVGTFRLDWKENHSQHMEMVIDDEGNFCKYFTRVKLSVPNQREQVVIETTYVIDIKVNEPIPDSVFTVR